MNWEEIIGDFLEFLGKDHEWILDHLDIWQLGAYHRRIVKIKVKEIKTQALMFYTATAGIEGVKLVGIRTPSDYWAIPEIEVRQKLDGHATEDEINAVASLFGGFQ